MRNPISERPFEISKTTYDGLQAPQMQFVKLEVHHKSFLNFVFFEFGAGCTKIGQNSSRSKLYERSKFEIQFTSSYGVLTDTPLLGRERQA
jgi:hypothetical protein